MVSENMQRVGSAAFVIGLIIAIGMGFIGTNDKTIWMLSVLGLLIGLINIAKTESHRYLIASIAFLVSASSLNVIHASLRPFTENIIVLVGPGMAIVALRVLFDIAKSR